MNDDTTTPAAPAVDASAIIAAIPMLRWHQIVRRYGLDLENLDAPEHKPALMLVLANERNRATTGRDDYERFEAMGMVELAACLTGPAAEAVDEDAEADKSGSPARA